MLVEEKAAGKTGGQQEYYCQFWQVIIALKCLKLHLECCYKAYRKKKRGGGIILY